MFHIFVQSSEIIEVIHQKYMQSLNDGTMTNGDKYMPLIMLNTDYKGKTALELAIELQRPKPFELMIDLLSLFNEFCFTKMMIEILPKMLF